MESQKLVSRLDAFVSCLFSRQRISAVVPFKLGSVRPGYKKITCNLQVLNPIQDAGSWSHELILVSKIPLHKEHWPLKLVASKARILEPSMFGDSVADFWSLEDVVFVDGLWLLCYFLVVIAVVLFVGCLLSLSIVFVLIVLVFLLKYCYCYSCYCCSCRRHSIQCPRLIWWSGCWNPNVPHRRPRPGGSRQSEDSSTTCCFPPQVTVASEGYSY